LHALNHNDIYYLVYLIVPSYVANAIPVLFGGGRSLDLGNCFMDGERIFGGNKTVKGFISGLTFGIVASIIGELILMKGLFFLGFLASLGSMLGDLFGSFIKRRLKIRPGSPLPLIDQLDFVIGALLLTYPIYRFNFSIVIFMLLITPPIHITSNAMAYLLKLKKQFW
jgi:CDP-2,3-bis-(O-geranylgeranyl)-sn-glycerol synthase